MGTADLARIRTLCYDESWSTARVETRGDLIASAYVAEHATHHPVNTDLIAECDDDIAVELPPAEDEWSPHAGYDGDGDDAMVFDGCPPYGDDPHTASGYSDGWGDGVGVGWAHAGDDDDHPGDGWGDGIGGNMDGDGGWHEDSRFD